MSLDFLYFTIAIRAREMCYRDTYLLLFGTVLYDNGITQAKWKIVGDNVYVMYDVYKTNGYLYSYNIFYHSNVIYWK